MPIASAARRAREALTRHGPRLRDAMFVAAALTTAFAIAVTDPPWPHLPQAALLAVGAIGSLALWWRRSRPVEVTVAGLVLAVLTQNPVTVVVSLFTLAIRRRDRILVALALATAAVVSLPEFVDRDRVVVSTVVATSVFVGFVVAAGAYIGARRDLLASLRDRADRAEAERELRATQARVAERARIAREMHDVLAHKVSLIALHAGALEVSDSPDAERVQEVAGLIRATARQTLEELRDVLGVLRADGSVDGADLRPPPKAEDIRRLVDSSRAAGVQAELHGDVPPLPDVLARAVHRIVQEGLTNVHKHARGASTSVSIAADERGISVSVDNRRPVAAGALLPGSGAGLAGLRERVRLLDGTMDHGPTSDGGWRLRAWLPWPDAQAIDPANGANVDHAAEASDARDVGDDDRGGRRDAAVAP